MTLLESLKEKSLENLDTVKVSSYGLNTANNYQFAVVKGKKVSKIRNRLYEFITSEFGLQKNNRYGLELMNIGYKKFVSRFAKFDYETNSVSDASLDLHVDIVATLFKIATEYKNSNMERIPVLKINSDGAECLCTVKTELYDEFYNSSVKAEETKAKAKAARDAKKAEKDAKELEEFGNSEELKENTLTCDLNKSQEALAMVIKAISIHGSDKNFMETIQSAIDNSIANQLASLPSANIA